MKTLVAIAFAAVLTMFGAATAFAQVDAYPPVAGDGGTVPPTSVATDPDVPVVEGDGGDVDPDVPVVEGDGGTVESENNGASLPATGGSGSSGLLQGGAILLAAGGAIFLVARRRSPVTAA